MTRQYNANVHGVGTVNLSIGKRTQGRLPCNILLSGDLMTMPHLMNCDHSEDWCLGCVKKLHDEKEALQHALKSARLGARLRGITTRDFAAMCAISPTQLSSWTDGLPDCPPDFKD